MKNLLILSIVVIVGCATPYASSGLMGGFSETQLAPNLYQVTFQGNGFTSQERAGDFTLLRSAELCLSSGYRYFVVGSTQDATRFSTYTSPQSSQTTGTAIVTGNTVSGSSSTTYAGGQSYLITKPGQTMLVGFFNEPPEGLGFVFDAEFIAASIQEKYSLEQ